MSFPNFLKFDLKTKKVTLSGSNFKESDKDYSFRLIAATSDGEFINDDYKLTVKTLFKNSAPAFIETIIS